MDSELQIGLVVLGVAAVVGILAYNKWQERKHRKHAENTFRSDHRDVLLEPQVRGMGSNDERSEPREEGYERPRSDTRGNDASPAPSGRHTTPGVPDQVDSRFDCMIRIESIEPLEAQRLWATQQQTLGLLERPVRWFAFDDEANLWRQLSPHSAGCHHWFCAAMQLVDRRGAIGEQQFGMFASGVEQVADQFLAVQADLPVKANVLANAAEIDRFCVGVDVQVGVNIVSHSQAFPGTKIRALAEASGMVLGDDGAFHALDEEGRVLFSLGNLEAGFFTAAEMRSLHTHGLTLVIDVPLVADGVHVFDRMMRQANQMAQALDGRVVDDNKAAFGPESAELIRGQIQHFQAQMAEAGVPAGGPLAMRLFSA